MPSPAALFLFGKYRGCIVTGKTVIVMPLFYTSITFKTRIPTKYEYKNKIL